MEKKNYADEYKDSVSSQRNHRGWARVVFILGALVVGYFWKSNEKPFATFKDYFPLRMQKLECSIIPDSLTSRCVPEQCGRIVSDNLILIDDAKVIKEWALSYFSRDKKVKGTFI